MLDAIVIILMAAGLFFFFGTTIGLHRFPDFYTRMHAAGKGDTLSSMLLLSGLALYQLHHLTALTVLVSLKILFIGIFVFIASPTATHAIMDAGFESKVKPWTKRKDPSEASNGDDQHDKGETK
ncbi:MAG: monovalent cation/H(+) antiporter subunit G [Desulfobulbaceae bacterium]